MWQSQRNITFKLYIWILLSTLRDRPREYAEKIIGDYPNGFRTNRGTINNICILRQITKEAYEYNIQIDILFIDFKQAFYSIYRHKIIQKITATKNTQ